MLKNMRRSNTEEFIEKAKIIHGDKYDYSKVEYINNATKVCIICKEHGEFWQTPGKHLKSHGCKKCNRKTNEEFINDSKKIYGEKYEYNKTKYVTSKTKVIITCQKHGDFSVTPNDFLRGHGCPKCGQISSIKTRTFNKNIFIEKAKKIHGEKYDYTKVEYVNSLTKVCIICPIHGEFWQQPNHHLQKVGCAFCKESKLEKETALLLQSKNIKFERQKKFDWLGRQSLDFFLPKNNIAIECQGRQHFVQIDHFGGKDNLMKTKKRDKKKKELCQKNNVNLQYINYDEDVETKLIEILNQYGNTTNM